MASALSTNEVTVLYNDVLFEARALARYRSGRPSSTPNSTNIALLTSTFVTSAEAQPSSIRLSGCIRRVRPRAGCGGIAYWVGQEHSGVSFTTIVQSFVGLGGVYSRLRRVAEPDDLHHRPV